MAQPDLKIRTFERFDGSVWRQYETPEYRYLLTGAGRRLLSSRRMSGNFHAYLDDYTHGRDGANGARVYLSEGGNAKVFSMGNEYVVKESRPESGSSLFATLERMDYLINAVQKHCPRWIDVPPHYGAAMSKSNIAKQFMWLQKIDHGVTIGDVINTRQMTRSDAGVLAANSLGLFGPIPSSLRDEVMDRYSSLKVLLNNAVTAEGLDPERYLPDISKNPYNVVLERLAVPVAESSIRYWIIDQ